MGQRAPRNVRKKMHKYFVILYLSLSLYFHGGVVIIEIHRNTVKEPKPVVQTLALAPMPAKLTDIGPRNCCSCPGLG